MQTFLRKLEALIGFPDTDTVPSSCFLTRYRTLGSKFYGVASDFLENIFNNDSSNELLNWREAGLLALLERKERDFDRQVLANAQRNAQRLQENIAHVYSAWGQGPARSLCIAVGALYCINYNTAHESRQTLTKHFLHRIHRSKALDQTFRPTVHFKCR